MESCLKHICACITHTHARMVWRGMRWDWLTNSAQEVCLSYHDTDMRHSNID
jgi:hypothetical protein